MDHYTVLGVERTASEHEISAAYRKLAQTFHPDKHPAAGDAERAQFERAMARINDAYAVLGDPEKRAAYDRSIFSEPGPARPTIRFHPPFSHQCMLCGSEPAAPFEFRYQQAYLIRRSVFGLTGNYCSNCALALGRRAQNQTLMTGWWGIISFFANIFIVLRNAGQLQRVSGMRRGARSDETVVAPLPDALEPGRSVFTRPGVVVAAIAMLIVFGIGRAVAGASGDATWSTGSCITGSSSQVHPVDCGETHTGRIVADAATPAQCPTYADHYVVHSGWTYCIVAG